MIKGVWRVLEEHLKGRAGTLDVPMQLLPHLKQLLMLERQSTTDHLLPISAFHIAWLVTFAMIIEGARIFFCYRGKYLSSSSRQSMWLFWNSLNRASIRRSNSILDFSKQVERATRNRRIVKVRNIRITNLWEQGEVKLLSLLLADQMRGKPGGWASSLLQ